MLSDSPHRDGLMAKSKLYTGAMRTLQLLNLFGLPLLHLCRAYADSELTR